MIWFAICMGIAAILGFLAAFWQPPSPPPVNLLSLAVGFMALAWFLERVVPG